MDSDTRPQAELIQRHDNGVATTDVKLQEHIAEGKLTYGGFISLLQKLGVDHHSARTNGLGLPIGRGRYFSVYRYTVSAMDYQSFWLSISGAGYKPFRRPVPRPNTNVAIKRINVNEDTGEIDISGQGQLYAMCREITALLHPKLREHENIVKLQAIIWENGLGTGYMNGPPLWPSLVMEYCNMTLAEFLLCKPLTSMQAAEVCHTIGNGLDALHSANIFHGDLKAENVLLKIEKDGGFEPKLADFGCSVAFLDKEGKTKYYVAGTRLWCAPECPGWFTVVEEIEATDFYSFGLLMLRVYAGGRNPFEEFGVIPEEWTPEEKLHAIQFMKETDSLYALICGNETIETLPPPIRILAGSLIANPIVRMQAINNLDLESELASTIEHMQSLNSGDSEGISDIGNVVALMENVRVGISTTEDEESNLSSTAEKEPDLRDPLSFVSTFISETFVPDCASLCKTKQRAALNSATRTRIVKELTSALEADGIFPTQSICRECCRFSVIDQDPTSLTPEGLLKELQQHLRNPLLRHTCHDLIGSATLPSAMELSAAIFGEMRSPMQHRKWMAIWQLFLATATGFGTKKDPRRALRILEDASTSGFLAAARYVLYAAYTEQKMSTQLPLRTWLVTLVLFSAGIPSDSFSALRQLDPPLSRLVDAARGQVYNGSTASFENLNFNSLHPRDNPGCEIVPGFIMKNGQHLVQDELFENTLLHLSAGSSGADLSMISYCINVLDIDINLRNAGGATPLLLACRAGREEKIMTLLELGADVNLEYDGGETPLHWLGLLSDPGRLLHEFMNRGADINAQIAVPKLLPNFIDGTSRFFMAAGPLVWAMAMENEVYVEALLRCGADINYAGPKGMSTIDIACWPRFSRFLPRLSRETTFKVTVGCTYGIIASWSRWNEMGLVSNFVEPDEQEMALDLALSYAGPFETVEEVYNFYRRLVSEAISESRIEILEIIFKGLSHGMAAVRNPPENHDVYVKSPFSHPLWADHYFAHEAARRGDAEVLKAVLLMNVDAAAIDSLGWSSLHTLSSYSDNPDCADVLISNGGSHILNKRIPGLGLSAFMNAIINCNFKVADRLLFYTPLEERNEMLSSHPVQATIIPGLSLIGHFVAWCPYFGMKPLEYLFNLSEIRESPGSAFIADENNHTTLLMVAAGFISDGAIYDNEYFATWRRKTAYQLILNMFPEPGNINMKDVWGSTALHLAAWAGNFDIATMLMDYGAGLNDTDKNGCTPLDVLFHPDPPYLQQDRESKKLVIENFKKGRNEIYTVLKSRGGIHKIRTLNHEDMAGDFPKPGS